MAFVRSFLVFTFAEHLKTIGQMMNVRFGLTTILSVTVFLGIVIKCSFTVRVRTSDDLFTINVTMTNFQTTQVLYSCRYSLDIVRHIFVLSGR